MTTRRAIRSARSAVPLGIALRRPAARSRWVGPASSERTSAGTPGAVRSTATGAGVEEPDVARLGARLSREGEREQRERDPGRLHASSLPRTSAVSCHGDGIGRHAAWLQRRPPSVLKAQALTADSSLEAVNPPPNTPAAGRDEPTRPGALDPRVESYRKLADVFHELLSEQSLDDLLQRIADTVGELIPYDDITLLRGRRGEARAEGRVRLGHRRRAGARRRAVPVRRRDHRLGGRAPRARAREPRRARPARALRRRHARPTPSR